ncbi:DUF4410 domain-containing protein [Corallincola platygyrae]|uniref:DUF4410 domain-containing protein n=1 Tax=Corallincola platygyrae TaxID=1193278 RepID=A0ABW4XUQ2_9GAMM
MHAVKFGLISLLVAFLAGCAGTKVVVEQAYVLNHSDKFEREIIDHANVTDKGMEIFETRLDSQLSQLGDSSANEATREVEITFTKYYMRHGAARALAGIMAGSDNITSTVVIKDSKDGKVLGKITVVSENPTATGSAKGLIEQHADKIISFIRTGKS